MHLHLVHDARTPKLEPQPRPAKVVSLEVRRKARRERPRLERPRPAA